MTDNVLMQKYRFNRNFNLIAAEEFLKDLFNSRDVIKNFQPLQGISCGEIKSVKFTPMTCNVLNMSYFDVLSEVGCVGPTGDLYGNYEEVHDGITLSTKMTQIMVMEDYEDVENWEILQDDKYQKEFIFNLMKHLALGGSLCQHSEKFQEYLDITKLLYKDMVAVAKD